MKKYPARLELTAKDCKQCLNSMTVYDLYKADHSEMTEQYEVEKKSKEKNSLIKN